MLDAEQHDFAVEVVGLDAGQPAAEGLPGRAAAALDALDLLGGENRRPAAVDLVERRVGDARGVVAGERFIAQPRDETSQVGAGAFLTHAAERLQRVAQVGQQLAVLEPHCVVVGRGAEAGRFEVGADGGDALVGSAREAPAVEQPGQRLAVQRDLAGHEEGGGHHDQHRVDIAEAPRRRPLVGHAVLRADDGDVRAGRGFEVVQRGLGVLAFHREQHDVVLAERDFGGVRGSLHFDPLHAAGAADQQPLLAHRDQVIAAGDQDRFAPRAGQQRADSAADPARAVDDVAHPRPRSLGGLFPQRAR